MQGYMVKPEQYYFWQNVVFLSYEGNLWQGYTVLDLAIFTPMQ
jgi:hypothetical protein